jgi:ABC-2 type transport system permease protein
MIRGIYAIVLLDLKRAWLDRARLLAGLAQPLLYLFVFGAGIGASSQQGAADYRRYIFPGVLGLSLLFSATFAAIVIVFDRQIGFFKSVLVSPLPRYAIAFGKILSGAIQSFVQGAIVLPFAPLAGVTMSIGSFFELVAAMALASLTFSALGVAVASRFSSATVFPIVSNALILPMFFLSGAMYPLKNAPHWMQIVTHLDPVAYAVDLMRGSILGVFYFNPTLSISVLVLFVSFVSWSAVNVFKRGEDDSSLGATQFNWRR